MMHTINWSLETIPFTMKGVASRLYYACIHNNNQECEKIITLEGKCFMIVNKLVLKEPVNSELASRVAFFVK